MRAENKRALGADGSQLREGMETLRDEAVQIKDEVVDTGRRLVRSGTEAIKDSALKVGERAKSAHEMLREFTTSRPTSGLLIALGVGAVVGLMLFRRR